MSAVSGIGLYRLRILEDGAELVGKVEVEVIMLFCSAMEIRVPEGHSSGNKDYSLGREKIKPRLTSHDDSSLVVDRLCHRAKGQNIAVTCFYFDFAARKEQSAAGVLGSLLKQMVTGMERVPGDISRAFQDQKKVIGGCRPQLADIVKMLQSIMSLQSTFVCIDALDECVGVQRFRVLESLKQILEKSPRTRIFITGRPHILAEIKRLLARRVENVFVNPTKDDIITYLRARLGEDEMPDSMDESLEADILEKIPENISEMCVGAMTPRTSFYIIR